MTMGLATFRKKQELRLHHILRLLIGVLIAITTIVILRHTLADGMEFLDTHDIIHIYHIPEEEINAFIIDPGAMLSALTIIYTAFFVFFIPLSYISGAPIYFMMFFFLSISILFPWSDTHFPSYLDKGNDT